MASKRTKVGVIGCGNISPVYLKSGGMFEILEIKGCSDIIPERSASRAAEFGCKQMTNDEIYADPEIEIVINITPPKVHAEIAMNALNAGKNVHGEKPLATKREAGRQIIETAKAKGLRAGSAPDTFLGGGLQTCRKLIDDGWIGEPIGAVAFMMGHGAETWHPDPEFLYKEGAGPMFDMGPYYLTALVNLIGPVKRVTGSARITFPERVITSKPKYGQVIKVEVPTHVAGILDFENGAVGTIITSNDVWAHERPRIEIYGTEGSLSVPDPNTFGGPVKVRRAGASEWTDMPLTHGYVENSRGLAAGDMAYALRSGRPHRANGDVAYHVLDIMHAFHDASREGRHIELQSTCSRPAPLPLGLRHGTLDE